MKRVGFHTLGCKLNFSETSTLARTFEDEGYRRVDFDKEAEIYVINTCSVTENADKECKRIVKKALNVAPEAKVIIVGCYAQLKPQEIAKIPGVNLVLGASEKFKITSYLQELDSSTSTIVQACEIDTVDTYVNGYSFGDRTRAFLKAQDGCDYSCSFCTIPLARGKSRSDSIEGVVKSAQDLANQGIKEIVLTGVNLGDFGKGNQTLNKRKEENFLELIQELDNIEGIERYRISSIEPNLLNDDIIKFVSASKHFVPHFHIPLQSGSDTLLKRMRRRYLSDLYQSRVEKIKELMPDCCIGVDVIVGFPGETEELFKETFDFLHALPISYLHVFTYSERDNTEAIGLDGVVPQKIRQERNQILRNLSDKKKRHFYESQKGRELNVLLEEEEHKGCLLGYTENYLRVKLPIGAATPNQIHKITISGVDSDCFAEAELLPQLI